MRLMLKRFCTPVKRVERLEKRLVDSLRNSSQYFTKVLGEPTRDRDGFLFPIDGSALFSIKVRYEVDNKFLGKIYGMIVDGRVAAQNIHDASEKAELSYSGILSKGIPFFKSPRQNGHIKTGGLVQALNQDHAILSMCKNIDLEFLRVFYDHQEEVWRIQARPYGGSVVAMIFPPARYNVMMPKGHAELLYSVVKGIASVIQKL
jgi:hypothetical protein